MSNRQFALKSKIGELIALLETIQANRVESVAVKIDNDEIRTYSVDGIADALSQLATEVISQPESAIASLEDRYEHDRADVLRMVGRLAEIVAATTTGTDYGTAVKHYSTF